MSNLPSNNESTTIFLQMYGDVFPNAEDLPSAAASQKEFERQMLLNGLGNTSDTPDEEAIHELEIYGAAYEELLRELEARVRAHKSLIRKIQKNGLAKAATMAAKASR